MTDLHLHMDAIDTLMFRDGRPFNQNDAGASVAVSVFPPFPPTIVGAVRAALWQQLGGTGKDWDSDKLGTGTNWQKKDDNNFLKPLSFGAPILLREEKDENGKDVKVPYFPMPLHILEGHYKDGDGSKYLTRLIPDVERQSDLGNDKRLPVPEDTKLEGVKPVEDRWINLAGMQRILDGCVPYRSDLIKRSKLWQTEPRVGIGIDRTSRTTSDGQLYMASHVRMRDDVSLYVELTGWKNGFDKSLRPLAGEHRMAEIRGGTGITLPGQPTLTDKRWCAIALSPVVLDKKGAPNGLEQNKIINACLGKPVVIGGWDSQSEFDEKSKRWKGRPIPLRNCIPAGSVWFIKGGTPPAAIGLATEWGFGQILIGKW